jgi:hypothetical protein
MKRPVAFSKVNHDDEKSSWFFLLGGLWPLSSLQVVTGSKNAAGIPTKDIDFVELCRFSKNSCWHYHKRLARRFRRKALPLVHSKSSYATFSKVAKLERSNSWSEELEIGGNVNEEGITSKRDVEHVNFSSYNVRTLNKLSAKRAANVKFVLRPVDNLPFLTLELNKASVDVCCLQETRLRDNADGNVKLQIMNRILLV